jgi:hypothetical protein
MLAKWQAPGCDTKRAQHVPGIMVLDFSNRALTELLMRNASDAGGDNPASGSRARS